VKKGSIKGWKFIKIKKIFDLKLEYERVKERKTEKNGVSCKIN